MRRKSFNDTSFREKDAIEAGVVETVFSQFRDYKAFCSTKFLENRDHIVKSAENVGISKGDILDALISFENRPGSLADYFDSRKSHYVGDGEHVNVPLRVFSNMRIFCKNSILLNDRTIPDIIKQTIQKYKLSDSETYNNCLTQEGINKYNEAIGVLRKEISEWNEKNRDAKVLFPNKLENQVLSSHNIEDGVISEDKEVDVKLKEICKDINAARKAMKSALFSVKETGGIFVNSKFLNTFLNGAYYPSFMRDYLNIKIGGKSVIRDEIFKINTRSHPFLEVSVLQDATKDMDYQFLQCIKNRFLEELHILDVAIKRLPGEYKKGDAHNKKLVEFYDASINVLRYISAFTPSYRGESVLPNKHNKNFYSVITEIDVPKIRNGLKELHDYCKIVADRNLSIKIDFGSRTKLAGWDINKESVNRGVILKKEGIYYLGILNESHLFNKVKNRKVEKVSNMYGNGSWEKMEYKCVNDGSKWLNEKNLKSCDLLPESILKLDNMSKNTPSEKRKVAAAYQQALDKWDMAKWVRELPGYKNLQKKIYDDKSELWRDVAKIACTVNFVRLNDDELMKAVKDGKLYLFRIYNKDLRKSHRGKSDNLHTMYWHKVFEGDPNYRLLGGGKIVLEEVRKLKNEEEKRGVARE